MEIAEELEEPRYVVRRVDNHAYFQNNGGWGDKETAKRILIGDVYNVRDELEEALGIECEVVMA